MTPTHAARLLLALLICSAGFLASASRAAVAVMNFDSLTGSLPITGTSPYTENGIKLDAMWADNTPTLFTVATSAKSFLSGFGPAVNNYRISLPDGRSFTMLSIRMAPRPGIAGNTTFTGRKADTTTVTQTFSHGTNSSGTVRTFPASFQDIVALEWSTTSAGSTNAYLDDITVELPSEIRAPSAVTVTEAGGTVNLGVTFEPPLARAISLTWQAFPGTASHPADYTFGGPTTATVSIPAGARDWSIPCTIVSDTTAESIEAFTIIFNTTSLNAYFAGSQATTVRIGNDDSVANFAGWMSGHGLTAADALPDADPNADGITNIETWLFRLNPAGPTPAAWLDRRATFHYDTGSLRPGIRFTVPSPLPSDVRMIFEENAALSTTWTEQARRSGFGVGSLWSGPGNSRVTEVANGNGSRTTTCGASLTTRQRSRAFLRMKYVLYSGGSNS